MSMAAERCAEVPGLRAGQVKTIWYTGVASFCWSCVRWLFTRSGVPNCGGLEMMPTFGYAALRQARWWQCFADAHKWL